VSRLPIKARLTLAFALAMVVLLCGAGLLVYNHVGADLARSLDQSLRSRAQDLSALVADGGSVRGTSGTLVERGESFAQVVDASGQVTDATPALGSAPLLTPAELARARRAPLFTNRPSVPGLDEPSRMLAVPVAGAGDRVLVVGATAENRAETLSSLRTAFLVGGPIALLLASLGGFALASAALRPIEAMRRRAEEISASSIEERLPVPRSRDEVTRLAETLNEMLARIDDGLTRERRFVADASHELRTPLSLLKTELELALRPGRSPDELRQAIGSAAQESDRLGRIADDLLLLARSEQGRLPLRLEPLDLRDVLEDVAARFAGRAATEGRTIAVQGATPVVVSADRLRLEQALRNMIDNAFRYGSGAVRLVTAARNGSVEVHVLDDGPGFPAGFLVHAFERFSRGDEPGGGIDEDGSGLGLAIVDTIAEAHGGTASAANRPEGGADVWITLTGDASR
jgi:two-component system OmpR family sensor kinase